MNNQKESFFQTGKAWAKKHPVLSVFGIFFLIGFISMAIDGPVPPTVKVEKQPEPVKEVHADLISKNDAQEQLNAFMEISKAGKLITSYEFSETAVDVFVDKAWYEQTVQFKKDFIAKVGMLKKAVTGYSHFELKDAYSNEKVGEIKSFSQSIEVYK